MDTNDSSKKFDTRLHDLMMYQVCCLQNLMAMLRQRDHSIHSKHYSIDALVHGQQRPLQANDLFDVLDAFSAMLKILQGPPFALKRWEAEAHLQLLLDREYPNWESTLRNIIMD